MGLKCRIVYATDGTATVFEENGELSSLYEDALEFTGNQDQALNIWATVETPEFQEMVGLTNPSLDQVLSFLDTQSSNEVRLPEAELVQVKSVMRSVNIPTLTDFLAKLNTAFKPNGYVVYSPQNILKSGLYSPADIEELNINTIDSIITKIEGELKAGNDPIVIPSRSLGFRDTSRKTIIGSSPLVEEQQILDELLPTINNFADRSEVELRLSELPYDDLTDKFINNDRFAREVMNKIQNLSKLPVVSIINGQISSANSSTFTTVRNTLLADVNYTALEADIEYIMGINVSTWRNLPDNIRAVLREIELNAVSHNIDIIGISENYQDRDAILDLLDDLNLMIVSPTDTTLRNFSEAKDALMQEPAVDTYITQLPENYRELNIVRLDTSLDAGVLFDQFALIKVADNLYHRVQRGQVSELYDYLYNQVLNGQSQIKVNSPLTDKVEVLKELNVFVNSRETGIDSLNQEEISLNQLVFKHQPLASVPNRTNSIKSDPIYLKTGFISEFYNYILREKYKNSDTYNNILRHFKIADNDISLRSDIVPDIVGIEMEQELRDYAKLKRSENLEQYAIDDMFVNDVQIDEAILNNPSLVETYTGGYLIDGQYLITPSQADSYIKVDDKLYRRVATNNSADAFLQVFLEAPGLYNDTNLSFEFNEEQADQVLRNNANVIPQAYKTMEQLEVDSKVSSELSQPSNELSQAVESRIAETMDLGIVVEQTYRNTEEVMNRIDECR